MRRRATAIQRTYLMAGAAVVLLLAVVLAVGHLLWDARHAAVVQAREGLDNLALSLERDIARNLQIYQLSLRATADGLRLIDSARMDEETERAVLFDGAATAEHFGPILVADASGQVVRSSARSPAPLELNVADRDYFQRHMDDPGTDAIITYLPRTRYSDLPVLALSMRVNRPDGVFGGVAVGTMRMSYVQEIFSRFNLGKGGMISLVALDGRRIAGIPADAPQEATSAPALYQRIVRDGPDALGAADISAHVMVARKLDRLPLFLVVGRPTDEVLADWRTRAWAIGGGMLVAAIAALGLTLALRQELLRRRSAEQAARSAELAARGSEVVAQQQAQAARASEAKLRAYFKHLADGLLAVRVLPGGALLFERANAAAQAALGLPSTCTGRSLGDLLPVNEARLLAAQFGRCADGGVPVQFAATRGGRELRFALAPVRDEPCAEYPDGRVAVVLASLRDVTHQCELEAQLRQAQRMEAVGQLTAGVAHDFNNLLQAQLGSLELLTDEVAHLPQAKAYAQMAMAAGERASQLTHSLLSFSRKQVLRPVPVLVPALLDGLEALLSRTLDPHCRLRVDVEAELPPVLADQAQLEAALLNLCLNGRDAMQDGGGRLLVEAYDGLAALDAPDRLDRGAYVVLAVSDEGQGMPPDVVARACEPFFTTKGVGKGSGLGLSMVQGFAQQSGGALRLQSWPGAGTRVELWLPRAEAEPAPGPRQNRVRGAGRVLLVDDAPEVLMVIGEMLEGAGFRVTRAAGGADALAALRTGLYDAMVTDFAMPGLNGAELVQAALLIRPSMPMLVITGYADGAVLGGVPSSVQVVHKPFRGDVLAERLCGLIGAPGRPGGRRGTHADGTDANGTDTDGTDADGADAMGTGAAGIDTMGDIR